jgi:dienelactone hydrolase
MMRFAVSIAAALAAAILLAQAPQPLPPPYAPSPEELQQIREKKDQLSAKLRTLRAADDLLGDVAIYDKAADWILRHPEEFYTKAYVANTLAVLDTGLQRADQLAKGESPWATRKGRVSRAYRSQVDGSLQPYGMVIPEAYDPAKPSRLDVVLHGRAATMNEVSFLFAHDSPKPLASDPQVLTLGVYGRTNNAYRWAGESDVFEALDSVRKRYKVDENRIVLRGFSMGGAGAWHIGLHYPDRWAGIEAGAGFNETMKYAHVTSIPDWQERTLNIYDAMKYALNAVNVPTVGYGGQIDPQLRASQNIQEQLASEGIKSAELKALFLVGPKTPHRWHPDSKKESDRFLDEAAARGRTAPDRIRFVTYTPRYPQCYWISVRELEHIYNRADVDARREGESAVLTTKNVARISIADARKVTIDGQGVGPGGEYEKLNGAWKRASRENGLAKRPGLQGPIDDAFAQPFMVVRPPSQFQKDWAKWMRGDLRVKSEEQVTSSDLAAYNLVIFGDPASSKLIGRINKKLPVRWEEDQIVLNGVRYSAAEHTLMMIYPNPLNHKRYVVLNTGHTFGEREFKGTNALLFPRLGDWAIVRKSDGQVVKAGIFDRQWRLER